MRGATSTMSVVFFLVGPAPRRSAASEQGWPAWSRPAKCTPVRHRTGPPPRSSCRTAGSSGPRHRCPHRGDRDRPALRPHDSARPGWRGAWQPAPHCRGRRRAGGPPYPSPATRAAGHAIPQPPPAASTRFGPASPSCEKFRPSSCCAVGGASSIDSFTLSVTGRSLPQTGRSLVVRRRSMEARSKPTCSVPSGLLPKRWTRLPASASTAGILRSRSPASRIGGRLVRTATVLSAAANATLRAASPVPANGDRRPRTDAAPRTARRGGGTRRVTHQRSRTASIQPPGRNPARTSR